MISIHFFVSGYKLLQIFTIFLIPISPLRKGMCNSSFSDFHPLRDMKAFSLTSEGSEKHFLYPAQSPRNHSESHNLHILELTLRFIYETGRFD